MKHIDSNHDLRTDDRGTAVAVDRGTERRAVHIEDDQVRAKWNELRRTELCVKLR